MTTNKSPTSFEQAIDELALIVNQIESNEIPLDTALLKYQQGISLIKFCQSKLAEAEQKVKILDPENNTLKDFAVNEA